MYNCENLVSLSNLQVNHTEHWRICDQEEFCIRMELDKMTFPWSTPSLTSTISACNSSFWSCLPFCPWQGQLPSISSWTWNSWLFIRRNQDSHLNIHLACSYTRHLIHHWKVDVVFDSDALSIWHHLRDIQGMFCYYVKDYSTSVINN